MRWIDTYDLATVYIHDAIATGQLPPLEPGAVVTLISELSDEILSAIEDWLADKERIMGNSMLSKQEADVPGP